MAALPAQSVRCSSTAGARPAAVRCSLGSAVGTAAAACRRPSPMQHVLRQLAHPGGGFNGARLLAPGLPGAPTGKSPCRQLFVGWGDADKPAEGVGPV